MSKKRLSLQSILDEERADLRERSEDQETNSNTSRPEAQDTEASRESKADFVRLSITIPPEDFDRLQAESLRRRRGRETYTFSHIVRLALTDWLDRIEAERESEEKG